MRLPVLKPHEVVSILEALGFTEVRQRGSHKQFRHTDGRATTVPFHKGRDISPVLLRKIAKDVGMSAEELATPKVTAASGSPHHTEISNSNSTLKRSCTRLRTRSIRRSTSREEEPGATTKKLASRSLT